MHIYNHRYTYIHTHVYVYVSMHVCMCIHICVCVYIYIYMYISHTCYYINYYCMSSYTLGKQRARTARDKSQENTEPPLCLSIP